MEYWRLTVEPRGPLDKLGLDKLVGIREKGEGIRGRAATHGVKTRRQGWTGKEFE